MTITGTGELAALELNFERRGSGRPLVLLHGWGLSWRSWLPVLDLLAEEREVFAVDLPGFGSSPPLPAGERYTRERLCESLEDFFAQQGIDRPDIAGNSLGGLLGLDLACRGSARSVTALCTPGFHGPLSVGRTLARVLLPTDRVAAICDRDSQSDHGWCFTSPSALFGVLAGRLSSGSVTDGHIGLGRRPVIGGELDPAHQGK